MRWILVLLAFAIFSAGDAEAQSLKLSAKDSREVQDCIKSKSGKNDAFDGCIGVVANPCLETPDGQSTVGQSQCYQREQLVWDDILNETYRRVQTNLDDKQKRSLRDVQRAWIESRKLQCGFYRDLIQGTLAIPLGESCFNTETARRAIYLLGLTDF